MSHAAAVLASPEVPGFGNDPWWLVVGKAVVVFVFLVVMTLFTIWWERRVVARMQHRIGPNRVGPQGLLQSLADGIKLALKEDIIPKAADKAVFILAPIISATPAFLAFAVIPFGPEVTIFGHETTLQLTDLPVAVLYILAVASVGIYGIVLAGWSSGSTYPLLGGLRSSAQMISYEVAMGLSFVGVFLYAGSMSTSRDRRGAGRLLVRRPAVPVVRHLRHLDGRRDQPRAVRPARGRGRAGRRLPHRVLVAEVRAVLPRRVHQHGHRLGAGDDAVPRRLAGPVAARRSGTARTRAGGRCSGSSARSCCSSSSSSGCAARCPGCATTSSCSSAGRCSSRSRSAGCSWSPPCARSTRSTTFDTRQVLLYGGVVALVLIGLTFVWDLVAARRAAAGGPGGRGRVRPDGRWAPRAAAARPAAARAHRGRRRRRRAPRSEEEDDR